MQADTFVIYPGQISGRPVLATPAAGDTLIVLDVSTGRVTKATLSGLATTIVSASNALLADGTDVSGYEGMVFISGGSTSELKCNFTATVDPTATDDSGSGYGIGSRWINVTTDKEFVCLDATATAAVWTETTAGAIGGSGITSINSQTGAAQTLAKTDDTNVTLAINSATDTHTFVLGWTGTLSHERGGLEADVSAWAGVPFINAGTTSQLKYNLAATSDPTATDDSGSGYGVGSRWINVSTDKEFVCLDATATAAVWTETTATGGGSLPVDDTTSVVQDPVDNTKQMRIDVGAVATATTRVLTMPDRNVDLSSGGTFAEASHTHAATDITSGSIADARISASSVTQHQAALSIAASQITGTLPHEQGGLEADVSAYSGLVEISAGVTSAVTVTAFAKTILDDADAAAVRTTLGIDTNDAVQFGNLTVSDLTVNGTTTTVNTATLTVDDPLIRLADNNAADSVDIGFYGTFTSGTAQFCGLFRDASDGKFRLFTGLQSEPTTTVNTAGTGYAVATLVVNIEGTVSGVDVTSHASRHERGGADELDGDHLDIDFTPTNYTPATTPAEAGHVDDLAAHLYGIDQALAGAGVSHWTEANASPVSNEVTSWTPSSATANVGAAIAPKGTGAFTLAVPDGTAAGGNDRGNYAVDLQIDRAAATEVASGVSSVVAGVDNTASGTGAVAIGNSNTASGNSSVAAGYSNTASGLQAVAIGDQNTASGADAVAIGTSNTADGDYSRAVGRNADTHGLYGARAAASGRIGSSIAQTMELTLRKQTTDATATKLTTDNNAASTNNQLLLANYTAVTVEVLVIGKKQTAETVAGYRLFGVFRRHNLASTIAQVGSTTKDTLEDAGASGWDADFVVDTTNGLVSIEVTGQASTTINWCATVKISEVYA